MPASDRIKAVVREEAERVADLGSEAARSGAYLYPIKVISSSFLYIPGLTSVTGNNLLFQS